METLGAAIESRRTFLRQELAEMRELGFYLPARLSEDDQLPRQSLRLKKYISLRKEVIRLNNARTGMYEIPRPDASHAYVGIMSGISELARRERAGVRDRHLGRFIRSYTQRITYIESEEK